MLKNILAMTAISLIAATKVTAAVPASDASCKSQAKKAAIEAFDQCLGDTKPNKSAKISVAKKMAKRTSLPAKQVSSETFPVRSLPSEDPVVTPSQSSVDDQFTDLPVMEVEE